jgi:hypothetical protein
MIETMNQVISLPPQIAHPACEIERAQTTLPRATWQRIEGLDHFYSVEIPSLSFCANARARE